MSIQSNVIDITEENNSQKFVSNHQVPGCSKWKNEKAHQSKIPKDKEKTEEDESNEVEERSLVYVPPKNINYLPPEMFQIILAMFIRANNWRKLVNLRLVNHFWRDNIDTYFQLKSAFAYNGRDNGSPTPTEMNYYQFNAMLSFFPNLKKLTVKNWSTHDKMVAILRQQTPNLTEIDLSGSINLSWCGITILAVRFDQLTFIDISNCRLDENKVGILIENLQNLRVFNAVNPGREVKWNCLSKLSPKIQDIWIGMNHLSNCNQALQALVSGNGRNIIHLGLVIHCYETTNWTIITENLPKLKSFKLNFSSFKQASLKELSKFKNLEFLILAENANHPQESVITDNSLTSMLRNCSKLKTLGIAGAKDNSIRLTTQSISQIPEFCRNLEQLKLWKCHQIDDFSLFKLASMQTLYVLHLSAMNLITNVGINFFIKNAKHIRSFRLNDCPHVTEEIIDNFIRAAWERPNEVIKLFFEDVKFKRNSDKMPSNLRVDINLKPAKRTP